jgi:hypothetical protein
MSAKNLDGVSAGFSGLIAWHPFSSRNHSFGDHCSTCLTISLSILPMRLISMSCPVSAKPRKSSLRLTAVLCRSFNPPSLKTICLPAHTKQSTFTDELLRLGGRRFSSSIQQGGLFRILVSPSSIQNFPHKSDYTFLSSQSPLDRSVPAISDPSSTSTCVPNLSPPSTTTHKAQEKKLTPQYSLRPNKSPSDT